MFVDGTVGPDLAHAGRAAKSAEDAGYDGIWSAEVGHDPFLPLLLAAEDTDRVQLCTSIAVAFARNPMTLATIANDLQAYSKGRFLLGLGSQIKAHIEKRYSMPWSHPAPRMRELVLSIRAIWDSWATGAKLDFRGDFYTHTLMTPFFNPGPNPHGTPKIFVAAVGELMTEVSGEVADGLLAHPLTSERYLKEVTLPGLRRGLSRAGKERDQVEISCAGFVVTGRTEEELATAARAVKDQIAFYASTPAYRGVLALHGWESLQGDLNRLSKAGEWSRMGELIDDRMLDTFAVTGAPDEIGAKVLGRFGGLIDRFSFYAPYATPRGTWEEILTSIKAG